MAWFHSLFSKISETPKLERDWIERITYIVNISKACEYDFLNCLPQYSEKCIIIKNMLSQQLVSERADEIIQDKEYEEWKKYTGAFIDESFLIDYLSPEEYFEFIAKISNITKEELSEHLQRFDAFMNGEIIGQNKLIRSMSAGNKQKIGIISSLIHSPQLVILDEPFNFLDPTSQNILKKLLVDYNKETGASILISSHNLMHTVDISNKIVLMEHGRIIRYITENDENTRNELEQYFNKD